MELFYLFVGGIGLILMLLAFFAQMKLFIIAKQLESISQNAYLMTGAVSSLLELAKAQAKLDQATSNVLK